MTVHAFPTITHMTRANARASARVRNATTTRSGAVTNAHQAATRMRRHMRTRAAAAAPAGVGELAFSLKPPKAVRNLVKKAASAVGIKAQVSTPAGPIVVDTRDPDSLKRAADAARELLSRTTVSVGTREAAPVASASDFVENKVPGGWLTVGALGIGGLILLKKVMG